MVSVTLGSHEGVRLPRQILIWSTSQGTPPGLAGMDPRAPGSQEKFLGMFWSGIWARNV